MPRTATRERKRIRLEKRRRRNSEAAQSTADGRKEEIRKVIEKEASLPPAERELIGNAGHWIEPHGLPAGDGRQKYSVWSPEGELISMIWGKDAAERAVHEYIETGKITR